MHNIINANILYQYINVVTFTYAAYLPCSHENIFVLFKKLYASLRFELIVLVS